MKYLVAVILLAGLVSATKYKVRTSSYLDEFQINNFLREWHPKGFPEGNDFIYSLATDEGRKVELTCASINIPAPCSDNVMRIIDGAHTEIVCGKKKNFVYKSKTNLLSVQLESGAEIIPETPECSAKAVD